MTRDMRHRNRMTILLGLLTVLILTLIASADVFAESSVTFDNQSGTPALVKLIGPISTVVEVPNGETRTVSATGGHYFILARYGTDESTYRYSKGDHFDITETYTGYSFRYQRVRITLHAVINGNYHTARSNKQEFDHAGASLVAGQ
jgi:hypothetical protein